MVGQETAYRADIDGLRALAVVLVLAFHAGSPFMPGGFVGVDVFFVISGYLITSIVYRDLKAGAFSFATFFERRIRRLFPALVPVCIFALAFAYRFYLPGDFSGVVDAVMAAATFSSNWLYAFTSGYFDAPAATKPLLHTWTLAVEWQFYIAFPILLVITAKIGRKFVLPVVVVLAVGSLAFAITGEAIGALRETMYLNSFARFYEILFGAVLALLPGQMPKILAVPARWIGVGLIIASALFLTEATPFPSYFALAPVIGSALVVWAGMAGRDPLLFILKSSPFTYVGRISYSLYLWHWPILVALFYFVVDPDPVTRTFAVAVSVGLAILSYQFVELPFRGRKLLPSRNMVFGGTAATIAVFAGAASLDRATNGMPFRFSPALAQAMQLAEFSSPLACRHAQISVAVSGCMFSSTNAPASDADLVVWGDSLATGPRDAYSALARNGTRLC